MTVTTPRLRFDSYFGDERGEPWFCAGPLLKMFDVPIGAEWFWLEGSTREKKESVPVFIVLSEDEELLYGFSSKCYQGGFCCTSDDFLQEHFTFTTKPRKLWIRLLFED